MQKALRHSALLVLLFPICHYTLYAQLLNFNLHSYATLDSFIINTVTVEYTSPFQGKWCGTQGAGTLVYDGTAWTGGYGNNVFTSAILFRNGPLRTVWEAGENGIYRFDTALSQLSVNNGLPENEVTGMVMDSLDHVWIATADSGIAEYINDSTWNYYRAAGGLCDDRVNRLFFDRSGNLWVGTKAGLSKFDGISWATYLTSRTISAIAQDNAGDMWIGVWNNGSSQLLRFNGSNWTIQKTFTCGSMIADIKKDQYGAIWMSTTGWDGLFVYAGNVWTGYNYQTVSSWPLTGLYGIAVDSINNKLWVGTAHYGLLEINIGPAGVHTGGNLSPGLNIFPSPAVNYLYVQADLSVKNSTLEIYNSVGLPVTRTTIETAGTVNISGLPPGIYTAVFRNEKTWSEKKFIISR